MTDTNDTRRPLDGLRREHLSLPDVAYAAHALYETVYFADVREAMQSDSAALWEAAEDLIRDTDPLDPTDAEAFGLVLMLRAILRHPEVLQIAAERIVGHLEALVDVKVVLSDTKNLAIVMPAVAERLLELHPELDERSTTASQENEPSSDDLDRADVTERAAGLVCALLEGGAMNDAPPTVGALWMAGAVLEEHDDGSTKRRGLVMELDAVLAYPGGAERAVRKIRDQLVEVDPALALMAKSTLVEYTGVSVVDDE